MEEYEHLCGEQVFLETAHSGNIGCAITCASKRNTRGNMHAGARIQARMQKQKEKRSFWDQFCPTLGWFISWGVAVVCMNQTKCWIYTRHMCFCLPVKCFVWNWNTDIKALLSYKARIVKYFKIMMDGEPLNQDFGMAVLVYALLNFHWMKLKSKRRKGVCSICNVAACCIFFQQCHTGQKVADKGTRGWRAESKYWISAAARMVLPLLLYRDP